jgi:hypothetical protein
MEGEAKALVEKSKGGIAVEPENSQAIADAVMCLYQDMRLRNTLGVNGKYYVFRHHNRKEIAHKFESMLINLTSSVTTEPRQSPCRCADEISTTIAGNDEAS